MTVARAGKRDYIVTVQEHNGTMSHGEPTYERDEDWKTIITELPATYRGVTGGEVVRGRQMDPETSSVLEVLYTPRTKLINSRMRLLLGDRVLNIVSVLDVDGMKRELMIQTKETA